MLHCFLRAVCLLLAAASPALALPKWQQFPPPPPMPLADQSGYAEVRGISMFYSVYGKGKGSPILLIHGGMSSSDVWSFEVPTLAQNHEVIVADSRGQGRSTHGLAWVTYHRMAEDYVALLAQLKVDKVTLVGWSDGGIIGIDIAIHHPQMLTRLFAQAPNVTPDGLTRIPEIDPPPLSENLSPSGSYEAEPELEKARNRQMARERVFRRLWATEPNYSDADLARIHVPTAIVIGDHDPVIRPEHIAHIAHAIPGARLVVLKDVGHPAHSQDPKQYLKAILDFMGEPPAATTAAPTAKAPQPPAAVSQSQVKAAPQAAKPPVVAQSQTATTPKAPLAASAAKAPQSTTAVAQSQTASAPKAVKPSAVAPAQATAKPSSNLAEAQAKPAPKSPQPAVVAHSQSTAPKAPQVASAAKASQSSTAVAQSPATAAPKVAKPPILIVPPSANVPKLQPAANSQTAGLAADQGAVQ